MAYLDKEAYERKNEYASKRMSNNAKKCRSLKSNQHEVLAWLCKVRHEVHCNQDDFFCSESANHTEYWDYIDDGNGIGIIRERLMNVGLPRLQWSFNADDYMTDNTCYYLDYTEEEREEERENCIEMANKFNEDIERYLREIDKQHGTDYCPRGTTRIY